MLRSIQKDLPYQRPYLVNVYNEISTTKTCTRKHCAVVYIVDSAVQYSSSRWVTVMCLNMKSPEDGILMSLFFWGIEAQATSMNLYTSAYEVIHFVHKYMLFITPMPMSTITLIGDTTAALSWTA